MSGINRFLSRREKHRKGTPQAQEKVKSPMPSTLPTPSSSSASSSYNYSGASTPHSFTHKRSFSSSCSLSSLSIAFPYPRGKGSPRLQPIGGLVQSTTANAGDGCLLQPRQTEGHLNGLFSDFEENIAEKDEEKTIKALSNRLSRLGITSFKDPDIEYVLNTNYAEGSSGKALDLLLLLEDSENCIVKDYNPDVKLLGAINRNGTTCYLDATLFAIFARLESFEAILYNTFNDEPRKRLSTLLRLWVNALRSGKLITTDITKQLQDALAQCGWAEAAEKRQQDASEAFSFITEKLELPMLTLKMDIFHQGKEDTSDDHKYVKERLLEVAIPEKPADGRPITLEVCLETYFNSRIEVRRFLERRATTASVRSRWSIDSNKGRALHIEAVEVDNSQPTTPSSIMPQSPLPPYSPIRASVSHPRAPSIIQEHYISEKDEMLELSLSDTEVEGRKGRPRHASFKKEILMPAWQFFSLIPWYTDALPDSDAQVAAHFSTKRPILGICLKRYSIQADGKAVRRGTYIDIPLEIALPHFIHDEPADDMGTTFGNFKLSLQSIVCHRGERVDSGHYVSLVRGQAPRASGIETSDTTFPEDRWMIFDDLARERIRYVDIQKALKEESPYLLFYQVQPIDGDPGNIEEGRNPPTYASTNIDYGDRGVCLSTKKSKGSLNGFVEEAVRTGTEEILPTEPLSRPSVSSERRSSIAFTDSGFTSPAKEGQAWDAAANGNVSGDTSLTVSRRPSKTSRRGSKSRPASQNGENRLSISFNRLAGKITKERPDSSIAVADPKDIEGPRPAVSAVSNATLAADAARLKKENKERSRSRHTSQHHHLHKDKGKNKAEKPDRECVVM
ncbi:hypothetical protein MMC13_007266 [Lambiella insularis]|nr:hypothetical protein [Lambiella insularis]